MKTIHKTATRAEGGFTLLELMAGLAILLVISSAAFELMGYYQRNYRTTQLTSDMHSTVRGAVELMTQEISQAGLINSVDGILNTTLSSSDIASGSSQAVSVGNAALFYPNEQLQVDTGINAEVIVITAVDTSKNTITAVFAKNHVKGTPIYAIGTIAEGIVPPASPYSSATCCDILQIIGDVNADGNLYLVEYKCDWAYTINGVTVPSLTRSSTQINASSKSAAVPLVESILRNPIPSGGTTPTPCFQFNSSTATTMRPDNTSVTYTYTTNISLTLTVQTAQKDPQTQQYLTMTKSFLDLSPRNINGAYQLALNAQGGRTLARPTTPSWLPQ